VIAGLAFHTAVNLTRRFMASIWRASSGAPVALLVRPHTPHPRCWPDVRVEVTAVVCFDARGQLRE